MDSFEWNKIIGAILGTLVFVMGVGFIAEAVYHPIEDHGVGYALPMPEGGEHGGAVAEEKEVTPLPVLLADASAEDGVSVAKKCASCHNFGEGEANKTGPGLYGVVGRPIASHEGFAYSDAMAALSDENWTYDKLNAFLESPKNAVPGTKMSFAGLRSEKDRADILAYLQTLSSNPVPFPEVAEAEPAADMEAVEGGEAESTQEDSTATGEATPATNSETSTAPSGGSMQTEIEPAAPSQSAAPAEETPSTEQTAPDAAQ